MNSQKRKNSLVPVSKASTGDLRLLRSPWNIMSARNCWYFFFSGACLFFEWQQHVVIQAFIDICWLQFFVLSQIKPTCYYRLSQLSCYIPSDLSVPLLWLTLPIYSNFIAPFWFGVIVACGQNVINKKCCLRQHVLLMMWRDRKIHHLTLTRIDYDYLIYLFKIIQVEPTL